MADKNINDPLVQAALKTALGLDSSENLVDFFYTKDQVNAIIESLFTGIVRGDRTYIVDSTSILTPAPQNLLLYSNDFSNAVWGSDGEAVTMPNSMLDVDGVQKLAEVTTPNIFTRLYQVSEVTPTLQYYFSFECRRGTMTNLNYLIHDYSNSSEIISHTSYYAQTSATETQRIVIQFTAPAGCVSVGLNIINNSEQMGTVYLGKAQLATWDSPYIETTNEIIT